jgi:hypothetical protein
MNYPMQAYGLGGLNTVQNMSDRNVAETLMANGGQRFARGGISSIPRMAAGGVVKYTYDPITGKYTPVDAATAASSDVPKYTYDPVTQRYTLDTGMLEKKEEFGSTDFGSGSDRDQPLSQQTIDFFDNETPAERDARAMGIDRAIGTALGLVPGPIGALAGLSNLARNGQLGTIAGGIANFFSPPGPVNYSIPVDNPFSKSVQEIRDPMDYGGRAGVNYSNLTDVYGTPPGQMYSPDNAYDYGDPPSTPDSGPAGADPSSDSGRDAGNSGSAPGGGAAGGGLMALAQGGASNLGDYSDGGRLLRGPGDGVSDSIPATIANKRPARLADGEFVVPARIVSELGNGSTEAGARKLYQMLARVQNARKKSIGQGRVAVNSRAEKLLPA